MEPSNTQPRPEIPTRIWVLFLLVMVASGVALAAPYCRDASPDLPADARPVTPRGELAAAEKSTIELFRQSSPSVVHITTLDLRRDRFSLNAFAIPKGTGSGFVWDEHGHVVTNFHVIAGGQAARVTLFDGSTVQAKVVGGAPDHDLAVLRIPTPGERLRPIAVGTSKDLRVGQSVYAIGNPFGLDQTLTTGVISGLGREIESVTRRPIRGVIQTDAAINPGNSGGPLLDSAGRLIGVNTAIYSPSGAYAGIGFAVPVDTVNRIVPQLVSNGRVVRPGLGIHIASDQILASRGIEGVLVMDVPPGSAAARAGLLATRRTASGELILGDLIVGVDGEEIADSNDLFGVIGQRSVGDVVKLTVKRGDRRVELGLTLQALD